MTPTPPRDADAEEPHSTGGRWWKEPPLPPHLKKGPTAPVERPPATEVRDHKPATLAWWAVAGTGAYALVRVIQVWRIDASYNTIEIDIALGWLHDLAVIAGYALLAMWMTAIRENLTAQGITSWGPPSIAWWGWLVPVANCVLPFLAMRTVARRHGGTAARRHTSMRLQLGWWIPFCGAWLLFGYSYVLSFSAFDPPTGDRSYPDVLNQMVQLTYASVALIVISWGFLVTIIRRVTAGLLETA